MGNPPKDSKEYKNKLFATKTRKQKESLKKKVKNPLVKAFFAAVCKEQTKRLQQQVLKLKERYANLNKSWVATSEEASALAQQVDELKEKLAKEKRKSAKLLAEREVLQQQVRDTQELQRYKTYWAWVLAFARPKTKAWLEWLWTVGPPRCKDGPN